MGLFQLSVNRGWYWLWTWHHPT